MSIRIQDLFTIIISAGIAVGLMQFLKPDIERAIKNFDAKRYQSKDRHINKLRSEYHAAKHTLDSITADYKTEQAHLEYRIQTSLVHATENPTAHDEDALRAIYDTIRMKNQKFMLTQDSINRIMKDIWERADSLATARHVSRQVVLNKIHSR